MRPDIEVIRARLKTEIVGDWNALSDEHQLTFGDGQKIEWQMIDAFKKYLKQTLDYVGEMDHYCVLAQSLQAALEDRVALLETELAKFVECEDDLSQDTCEGCTECIENYRPLVHKRKVYHKEGEL